MSSEDSSSEEDTEKLKEATWTFKPATTNVMHSNGHKGHEESSSQSRRTVSSEHENDGNELQTTPEFRAHVAKRLGAVIDSCIAEVCVASVPSSSGPSSREMEVKETRKEGEEEQEEGFRLFSTSVPGMSAPPPPRKRRPAPSSSDSDGETERRCKEVAVTLSDIVRPYYTEKSAEKKDLDEREDECKGDTCETSGLEKKKKKKKKKQKSDLSTMDEAGNDTGVCPDRQPPTKNGTLNPQMKSENAAIEEPMKKKKKKKKKKSVAASQLNGD